MQRENSQNIKVETLIKFHLTSIGKMLQRWKKLKTNVTYAKLQEQVDSGAMTALEALEIIMKLLGYIMNADGSNQVRIRDEPVPGARPEWCCQPPVGEFFLTGKYALALIILLFVFLTLVFLRRRN